MPPLRASTRRTSPCAIRAPIPTSREHIVSPSPLTTACAIFVDSNPTPILDQFVDQPPTTYFVDFALSGASHTIKVEYYNGANAGTITVTIQNVNTLPAGWTGQYYNNMALSGSPVFSRNDGPDVNFVWNDGSPDPQIPVDGFSIRWTRTITFNEGVYQFSTTSDDGSRVFVDGQLILNAWQDQPPTTTSANKQMSAGPHTIVVEYYENGGGAQMQFGYDFRPDLGGFVTSAVVSGFGTATTFAFAPDGRIFIGQKDGTVRIFKNGALLGPAVLHGIAGQ